MGFAKARDHVRRGILLYCLSGLILQSLRECLFSYYAFIIWPEVTVFLLSSLCQMLFLGIFASEFCCANDFCAVTCKVDTIIALAFSAYWVALILPCWRLFLSVWHWVRGGSSWAMGLLAVLCAADLAKRERWRTIGLWSVGGPDLNLRLREGLGII